MTLESKVNEFLIEKFVFKNFEIDEWLNKRIIIRFQHRNRFHKINNNQDIKYLANQQLLNWEIINKDVVNYFFDEFCWFLQSKYNFQKSILSKKSIIKNLIQQQIEQELTDRVKFDSRIKPFFDKERIKVKGKKPIPKELWSKANPELGQECYICRNSSSPYIVDPAFVYKLDTNSPVTMYHLMYFTNFGDYFGTTNKLEINGYGFVSVYDNEFGLTPEEAVKNKY